MRDRATKAFLRCNGGGACSALFILVLAVIVSYANGIPGVFQFDDYKVIVDYPTVHSLAGWWENFGRGLRPLLKLSYTLNWISGAGEAGFHLTNLGLHLVGTLLVYQLSRFVFPQCRGTALTAALLFAVHPAASEAITYISGRSMSLMTVFYLGATLAYLKGARDNDKRWLYVWSPLLFLLAVASKETALLLPFTLLLWEICFTRPLAIKTLLARQAMHWLLFAALFLAVLANAQYRDMLMVSAGMGSLQANFLTQLHAMTYMLGQLLLPWRMNVDPEFPLVATWSQGTFDLALWLALSAAAILSWRRHPLFCFALGWFVLQSLPIYVFLPRYDVLNDRHLYLSGFPMLMLVAAAFDKLRPDFRIAAVALVSLALAGLSISRNRDYYSEVALWESTVKLSPNKSRAYNNLGYAYQLAGRLREAERAYLTALELDPHNLRAENNLASLKSR